MEPHDPMRLPPGDRAVSQAHRITVLRPLQGWAGPTPAPADIDRAIAGDASAVRALVRHGGYTSLGEANLPDKRLPRSQAGDIMIAHGTGHLHVSTGTGHILVGQHLLSDLGLCATRLDLGIPYAVVFQTRAIAHLAAVLTALSDRPAPELAARIRAQQPFGLDAAALHRLIGHALDASGRIYQAIRHGQSLPSEEVRLVDVITRIDLQRQGQGRSPVHARS